MNDNLARIFAYLEKASADKATMSDEIVEEAGEYFKKALLEHLSASMAINKNVQASYLSIYKKKFDTYRQIATMGKR